VLFLIFARDHKHAFDDNFYGTIYVMERILQDQPAHQDFILITDCAGFGYNHIPPFATLRDWGEDPADYVTTEIRIAEGRFTAWPPKLQLLFAPARTVATGRPAYSIEPKEAA